MDVFNGIYQHFLTANTIKNVHRNALYVTHFMTLRKCDLWRVRKSQAKNKHFEISNSNSKFKFKFKISDVKFQISSFKFKIFYFLL